MRVMVLKESTMLTLSAAVLFISGCHPWFDSLYTWEEKSDPNQKPVITNADGGSYESASHDKGTPSYVPLIDACISKGGSSRGECIESLPPEELAKLEAEEARRGAMRRRQMHWRQAYNEDIAAFGFAAVDLPAGWRSRFEKPSAAARQPDIEYFQSGGAGVLRMQTLLTPVAVTQARLRNLTNVDPAIPLAIENWGDFAGYHYEQIENDTYYRHWWLAKDSGLILITYQCEPDMREAEREQVDAIINSLREQETAANSKIDE